MLIIPLYFLLLYLLLLLFDSAHLNRSFHKVTQLNISQLNKQLQKTTDII